MNWWEDPKEIARLLRWLWEEDNIDVWTAIHVVETAPRWDAEYQEMCRSQMSPGLMRANARLADGEDLADTLQASLDVVRAHRAGGGR